MDRVALFVGGRIFKGWKEVTVARSINAVSGQFGFLSTDRWSMSSDPWQIHPGDECRVELNGVPMITGWVDVVAPSYDEGAHAIAVAGRDRTADLVDCSAVVPSCEIRGMDLEGVARLLCKPFGIEVTDRASLTEIFPSVSIQPGETAWECLERCLRQREAIITTDGEGRLIIDAVGRIRADESLREGENILSASSELDYSMRFSEYIVRWQEPSRGTEDSDPWAEVQHAVQGRATDGNVKRYRPMILTAESQVYEGAAITRAAKEARKRAGESTEVRVAVQGWTQESGELWTINSMVHVKSPTLYLDHDLVLSDVEFRLSGSGTVTSLTLRDPDAFLLLEKEKSAKAKTKKKAAETEEDYWREYQ